jgi:uncharacterized membrane protein YidH (DUF202 family)
MNPFIQVKSPALASDEVSSTTRPFSLRRVRTGLGLTLAGFLIFMIGARPDFFGLDRSPIIGFVQIAVFLVGLAIMCLGGYLSMMAPWRNQVPSIAMDFGVRLVSTGYVVTVFAGMADVFGFGSHVLPDIPFFGPWQARGVMIGQAIIAIGFLLLIPFPVRKAKSHKS